MKYLLLILFTLNVLSATTGTLILKGTVQQQIDIVVTPTGDATTLDLSTTQTNLKVADVTESSNGAYKILLSSANGGKLLNTSGDFVNYTLNYDGVATDLTTGGTVKTNTGGVNTSEVTISYTGVDTSSITSGDYTDTITLTIEVN